LSSDSSEEGYPPRDSSDARHLNVVRLGLVSAASAIAGGLAFAWWYRKTLTKLQNPIVSKDIQEMESGEADEDLNSSSPGNTK